MAERTHRSTTGPGDVGDQRRHELFQLGERIRRRATELAGYQDAAARAFQEAATIADEEVRSYLNQKLKIKTAAREYGWNYEALRRRVTQDPALNAGAPGQPLVTRQSMGEIGAGRGSRSERAPNDVEDPGQAVEPTDAPAVPPVSPAMERLEKLAGPAIRQRAVRRGGRAHG